MQKQIRGILLTVLMIIMAVLQTFAAPTWATNQADTAQPLTTSPVSTSVEWATIETSKDAHSTNSKLDTPLLKLSLAQDKAAFAQQHALDLNAGRLHVQIVVAPDALKAVRAAIADAGGEATGSLANTLQGWLPLDNLELLAARDDVLKIHQPIHAELLELDQGVYTTEGLALMNGDAWHTAMVRGQGVKVGVIDAGFQDYLNLLGSDLPDSVTVQNFADSGDVQGNTSHGTACAEVVYDVAPDAEFYLIRADTDVDLAEAIAYAIEQEIDVISTSIGWYVIGPGDGTGEFADLAASLRSADAFWATAAGNDAQVHWGGPFHSDGSAQNPTHLFNPVENQNINFFGPGNNLAYDIPAGTQMNIYLRWDDWSEAGATQDYDLFLYYWNGDQWNLVADSTRYQAGAGSTPVEYISYSAAQAGPYGVSIAKWDASRDVHFELFAPNLYSFDERVVERSITQPADVPTVMAVGAANASSPDQIESYSAHGPNNGPGGIANGGATKPDLVAYDAVSTTSHGIGGFAGTSAATPHVAGAAALIRSGYPGQTVEELWSALAEQALDQDPAGKDNTWGWGRLYLGDAPPMPTVELLSWPMIVKSGETIEISWQLDEWNQADSTRVDYGLASIADPQETPYPYHTSGYTLATDGVYSDSFTAPDVSHVSKIHLRAYATSFRASLWSDEQTINVDPHEPDDTPLQVVSVDAGEVVSGYIRQPQDLDWYTFSVDQPGTRIVVTMDGGDQADLDLMMFSPVVGGSEAQKQATWDIGVLEDPAIGNQDDPAAIGWEAIGWEAIGWEAIGWEAIGWEAIGNTPGPGPEQVEHTVWWNTGDVYVVVGGHNGSFDAATPYTLQVELDTSGALPDPPDVTLPTYTPTPEADIDTLFVSHQSRLAANYGDAEINPLWSDLITLTYSSRNGQLIDLSAISVTPNNAITDAYALWDANSDNPFVANAVVEVVRKIIMDALEAYPNVEYIVIVGDDNIVPFYRVPDETAVGNEGIYRDQSGALAGSPAYAALDGQFYLTDNYYADSKPLPWRGRELFVPQLAIGRLVEAPSEMRQVIQAYWDTQSDTGTLLENGLVTGYDFLTDQALLIEKLFNSALDTENVSSLINDTWTDADLRDVWLNASQDLVSLNAHFTHDQAIPADLGVGGTPGLTHTVRAEELLSAPVTYSGTLGFSVGCHSGYSAHDSQFAGTQQTDFAQAIAARGGVWIGNSGHGIGETVMVGYSEDLAARFAKHITQGEPVAVGQALMQAKQDYLMDAAGGSFSVYDEKVIVEPILYGLPFWTVVTPYSGTLLFDQAAQPQAIAQARTRVLTFTNTFSPSATANGNVYNLQESVVADSLSAGGPAETNLEVNFGRPALPVMRYNLGVTGTYTAPRGVRVISADVDWVTNVNPVINRLITEHVYIENEPAYDFGAWYPAQILAVNRLGNWFQSEPQLVAFGAQFRSSSAGVGVMRLYDELVVEVYYAPADESDRLPPIVQRTQTYYESGRLTIATLVTDTQSGMDAVSVLYSLNGTEWRSLDLTQQLNSDVWSVSLSLTPLQASRMNFVVQALDNACNVNMAANKGQQFQGVHFAFLPVVIKE